jgi:hypothetical protein
MRFGLIAATHDEARLELAGRSVLVHQANWLRAHGVEAVICIASGPDPAVNQVQRLIEKAGLRFHLVTGGHRIVPLVSAADTLLAIAPGVVPPAGIPRGTMIVTCPVDAAQSVERIDRTRGWAGLFALPGRLVQRLGDLPADVDTIPALLRIGLQAGVEMVDRADLSSGQAEGAWLLLEDEEAARSASRSWIAGRARQTHARGPGGRIASLLARMIAPAFLRKGVSAARIAAGGGIALLLGAGLGAAGYAAAGLE